MANIPLDLNKAKGVLLLLGALASAVAGMGATLALSKNKLDDTAERVVSLEKTSQQHDVELGQIGQSLQDVKEATGRIERLLLNNSQNQGRERDRRE